MNQEMNRMLPVYLLAALLIHGIVLWVWARTPPVLIGSQEPPSMEIEISEEQHPSSLAEPANEEPPRENPPRATAAPDVPQPKQEPAPESEVKSIVSKSLPTEAPKLTSPPTRPPPVATKPRASIQPAASQVRSASSPSASRPACGSGKDRSHASWNHRVTPSYPSSALLSRKSGRVLVSVQINALGQATAASVTTSSGNPILDAAAVCAARSSTYYPKCLLGVPLPDTVAIPYNFDIRER